MVEFQISNVNMVKLLSERTSGVPPVIFKIGAHLPLEGTTPSINFEGTTFEIISKPSKQESINIESRETRAVQSSQRKPTNYE